MNEPVSEKSEVVSLVIMFIVGVLAIGGFIWSMVSVEKKGWIKDNQQQAAKMYVSEVRESIFHNCGRGVYNSTGDLFTGMNLNVYYGEYMVKDDLSRALCMTTLLRSLVGISALPGATPAIKEILKELDAFNKKSNQWINPKTISMNKRSDEYIDLITVALPAARAFSLSVDTHLRKLDAAVIAVTEEKESK